MTEQTTTCAHGCTTTGQHTTTCDGTCHGCTPSRNHYADCKGAGPCRGCLPRPAEYGLLCAWCWQQLHADLIDAPQLVDHLRDMAQPNAAARPFTDNTSRTDPAERDMLSAAIDAADELHAQIASWALVILEEHPEQLAGPPREGWWTSDTHWPVDEETGEPYESPSRVVGIRATNGDATQRLVTWLIPHLPWAARQAWIDDMRGELKDLIATTRARWPQTERPRRHVKDVPCSRCDKLTLTYSPPRAYKHPFVVTCTDPDCGRIFTEDEWDAHLARHMLRKAGRVA